MALDTSTEAPRSIAAGRPRVLPETLAAFGGFALITVVAFGLYAYVRAPVLNPETYLDPWIYTALFTNFDYLYHAFTWAYWTSRLPWIIPGITANWLLSPVAAFFALHTVYFIASAGSVFALARRFFNLDAALVAAGALMLSPLFFDANNNDYPDGATITYLLLAGCFAIGRPAVRHRLLRMAVAGFFAAAAFGTQIYASVAILGLMLVYGIVESGERGFIGRLWRDAAAAAVGALALLVGCGSVAKTHGGEFLFFMPSWRYAQSIQLSRWKRPGYEWMLQEGQLLIPLFLALLLIVLLVRTQFRAWRHDPSLRFAVGTAVFLVYADVFLGIWEFFGGGDFLEVYYYFSLFLVPSSLALASCAWLIGGDEGTRGARRWGTAAALAAACVPVLAIYRFDAAPLSRGGFYLTAALMGSAVALTAVLRFIRRRRISSLVAGVATVLLVGGPAYGAASGYTPHTVFGATHSYRIRAETLDMSLQLIDFMRRAGLQKTMPPTNFWYDGYRYKNLNGLQSAYLWGITWIGRDMPHLARPDLELLRQRKPPYLVLICGEPGCAGGRNALEAAGVRLRFRAATILQSGDQRFWVNAYRLPQYKVYNPNSQASWWRFASRLVAPSTAPAVRSWSFRRAVPTGWNGDMTRGNGSTIVNTRARKWNYEVVSPKLRLEPGRYRIYLDGQVVNGGLDLGVLDTDANKWIAQRFYWRGQRGFDRRSMMTPFTLTEARTVEIVLSNWVPTDQASRWELRAMQLVRIKP